MYATYMLIERRTHPTKYFGGKSVNNCGANGQRTVIDVEEARFSPVAIEEESELRYVYPLTPYKVHFLVEGNDVVP